MVKKLKITLLVITSIFIIGCSTSIEIPKNSVGVVLGEKTGHKLVEESQVYKKKNNEKLYVFQVENNVINEKIEALFKDGIQIEFEIVVRYNLKSEMVFDLFEMYGTNYNNTFIIPEIRSKIRDYIGKLLVEDIIEEEFESEISKTVTSIAVFDQYFEIKSVKVSNLKLPK